MKKSKRLPGWIETKKFYALALPVLLALGFFAYWPSFHAPFHFDDYDGIINNPYIRITSLTPHALSQAAFQDFKQNRPMSNLSFGLNYYFNSLEPLGYHLVNFLFYLLSGIFLFFLLERVFRRAHMELAPSRLLAFLTALLWMSAPVNVQAVTYIIQRHTAMSGCFSLLALLCYDLGRSRRSIGLYAACASSALCAMLSKETALVLPLFIFIYDLWFFQELKPGWLKRNQIWLPALVVFYFFICAFLMRAGMGNYPAKLPYSLEQRNLSEGRALLWYLGIIILPTGPRLSLDHEIDLSSSLAHPLTTLPAFIVVLALIAAALWKSRSNLLASYGVLWYFGQLALEAMPLPIDVTNEHRLYLASVPILALIPFLALRLNNRKGAVALCLGIALLFSVFTFERNQVWRSPRRLWRDSAMKAPHWIRPWTNYCNFLMEANDDSHCKQACTYAAVLDPSDSEVLTNKGICDFRNGDLKTSEQYLLKAIERKPEFPLSYFNLGLLKVSQKDYPAASHYFEQALARNISDSQVYYNMGMAFEIIGEPLKAIDAYSGALKMRPEWMEPRIRAAIGLANAGRCPEALRLVASAPAPDPQLDKVTNYCKQQGF